MFKVKTPDGVIVLENVPKDSEILVDGDKITFAWPGSASHWRSEPFRVNTRLKSRRTGSATFGEVVTVKTDESEEVTVRLEPLVVNRDAEKKQPETGAKQAEESKTAAVKVPRSDLDRIATGKWVRLADSKTVLSDPQTMKFENGILELDNTKLLFPKISARDVILRTSS